MLHLAGTLTLTYLMTAHKIQGQVLVAKIHSGPDSRVANIHQSMFKSFGCLIEKKKKN